MRLAAAEPAAARLLPAGERMLRTHPVASLLVVAGFLRNLYLAREEGGPLRLRSG